jgi:predicted translin family RNA/ssDNA-binding protein
MRLCRSYSAVMEEYAEAAIFKVFLTEGRILKSSELRELVQVEE